MKLSILVPSRNMHEHIDRFFNSIYDDNTPEEDFEVIVVDSSTDQSMSVFQRHTAKHTNLKVIHYDCQVKCGTARNIAFKHSQGEYIYCMDIDDQLLSQETLQMVLERLGDKDIYYCPYNTEKSQTPFLLRPVNARQMCDVAIGVWSKMYRREFYVDFPEYMPEDVAAHYLLIDKCKTFGFFDFGVYHYNNTNPSAISRTFDYCRAIPHHLMQLAFTTEIEDMHLRQEYISGVIHNLADMFDLRDKLKTREVREAWRKKLTSEYNAFMSGAFVH